MFQVESLFLYDNIKHKQVVSGLWDVDAFAVVSSTVQGASEARRLQPNHMIKVFYITQVWGKVALPAVSQGPRSALGRVGFLYSSHVFHKGGHRPHSLVSPWASLAMNRCPLVSCHSSGASLNNWFYHLANIV